MTEEELRQIIRELINRHLEEMSSTGGVAGYLTPNAFSNTGFAGPVKKKKKKKVNKNPNKGYIKVGEDVNEGRSKYYSFKSNSDSTARQKIGISVREVKKNLKEIDTQLKILSRFKNEIGYSTSNYWKRTLKDIYTIEGRLLKISQKLRELKS